MTTPSSASPSTKILRQRLYDPLDSFSITPRPMLESIGLGSVDLSVGGTFLIASRASVARVSASRPQESRRLFVEQRRSGDDALVVLPGQFVLAATLEYLSLPADLCGFVQSRSTYGRLGLISATATYVTAGYQGCPTLEIANVGEVPVELRRGDRICQIVLFTADEDAEDLKRSRYHCATRPYPAHQGARR
jgi:deoxycytidine triphosphate deaminase